MEQGEDEGSFPTFETEGKPDLQVELGQEVTPRKEHYEETRKR